ncbi:MAG TPA: NAD(P)H-quinone oxidoreductase [Chryseolinea sp.]|nr:NAD(P)H-quinone oxidoreductase [Chryseolinea sp.]
MRAVVITNPGDSDVLHLANRPEPMPLSHEVLVEVKAAGVNRPDVAQRKGHYPPPSWTSQDIPGLEIAGTVVSLGDESSRWKVGDNVCALVSGGGYAEYCAVPAGQCLPIPSNLSFVEAASLPETFFTVWSNVFDRGRLKKDESLLVHGGSSGIGVAAIQLAKVYGAKVYVTAGTDEKCRYCEKLGADRSINYKKEKFPDVIKQITQNQGVNVILDMVGGSYTNDNLDILAEEGRLVLISSLAGDHTDVRISTIMRKRLTITGSTLRSRDTAFKTYVAENVEEHVWPLLRSSKIKPIVFRTFPLQQAADAHRLMESSNHIGKIVLEV